MTAQAFDGGKGEVLRIEPDPRPRPSWVSGQVSPGGIESILGCTTCPGTLGPSRPALSATAAENIARILEQMNEILHTTIQFEAGGSAISMTRTVRRSKSPAPQRWQIFTTRTSPFTSRAKTFGSRAQTLASRT